MVWGAITQDNKCSLLFNLNGNNHVKTYCTLLHPHIYPFFHQVNKSLCYYLTIDRMWYMFGNRLGNLPEPADNLVEVRHRNQEAWDDILKKTIF